MPVARLARFLIALPIMVTLACRGDADDAMSGMPIGHLYEDTASGAMIDLPANWRGRYHVAAGVTTPMPGLEREIALRFVKADSTEAAAAPMLVAFVFRTDAWEAMPGGDTARAHFGELVGRNDARALVVRRAAENPFAAGTADALAYDSLMVALFQRPLRTAMRPAGTTSPSGPASPATSSP